MQCPDVPFYFTLLLCPLLFPCSAVLTSGSSQPQHAFCANVARSRRYVPRVSEFPTRTAAQQPPHGTTFPSFRPIPPALFSFYLIFFLFPSPFSLFSNIAMEAMKCDGSRGPFTSLSSPLGYHPPIFCTLPPFMLLPPSVSVPFSVVPLLSASFSFNHHVVLGTWSFGAFLLSTFFPAFPGACVQISSAYLPGLPFSLKFPANSNDALPTVQTYPATLQFKN